MSTNQEIINHVNFILVSGWKFEMDDFYGGFYGGIDGGIDGLPYPEIESLDVLYWKKISIGNRKYESALKDKEKLQMIKDLNLGDTKIYEYNCIGKFIVITLHKRLINQYYSYLRYFNSNAEEINKIYEYFCLNIPEQFNKIYKYLEENIPPEQFIKYVMFSKNKN